MLNKILDVTRKITNIIVTFLFMVVVAVVFAQVVARYVAGSSIRWADELARFAFVWLVYLGAVSYTHLDVYKRQCLRFR